MSYMLVFNIDGIEVGRWTRPRQITAEEAEQHAATGRRNGYEVEILTANDLQETALRLPSDTERGR